MSGHQLKPAVLYVGCIAFCFLLMFELEAACVNQCKVYVCISSSADGTCLGYVPYQGTDTPWTANPSLWPRVAVELQQGCQVKACDTCSAQCANAGNRDAGIAQLWPNPDINTCASCANLIVVDRQNCYPGG